MKKYVFIHESLIDENSYFTEYSLFENISDEKLLEIAKKEKDDVCVYNSFEEFIYDFNNMTSPDPSCWFGRAIDIPE